MDIIFVFIGGALGSLLRYLLIHTSKTLYSDIFVIFLINILGCFVIGFVYYIAIKRHKILSENITKLLSVGFAGGFTTFSGMIKPVLDLINNNQYLFAFTDIFLNVLIGLIFVSWGMNCGYYLISWLIRSRIVEFKQGDE